MPSTPLPASWVESLFAKMAALYGESFARKWEGVPKADLMATWAEALWPYADEPPHRGERLKWALDQLRDNNPYPPTLPEFVQLLRQAPRPQRPALPEPKVPASVAQKRAAELAAAARRISEKKEDGTAWAKTPPAMGASGSAWERAIVDLAEAGDARFVAILGGHVAAGVIRSDRAKAAAGRAEAYADHH